MKATNNLNMDLKEEIDGLNNELGKLRIFKDDYDEMVKELTRKMEKESHEKLEEKEKELKRVSDERDVTKRELTEMKNEYNRKMNQVKLLEMELENKLAGVKNDVLIEDDDADNASNY